MYCIKCGKQIPDGQVACNECTLELLQKEFQTPVADEAPVAEEPIVEKAPIIEEAPNVEAPLNYTEPVVNNTVFTPLVFTHPKTKKKTPKSPCSAKATVSFILSCVSLYFTYLALAVPGLVAIILDSLFIAPAIISIIFGAKSLSGSNVHTEFGVKKDKRTFIFGLIGMIQGIISTLLVALCFLWFMV